MHTGFTPALIFLTILLTSSCRSPNDNSHQNQGSELAELDIRLKNNVDRLMPFFSQSVVAGQMESLLYASLAYYDEKERDLKPYLAEKNPEHIILSGMPVYKYSIREDARWDNGTAVTARDVLFSIKWALSPVHNHSGIGSYLNLIDSIYLDDNRAGVISIRLNEPYILAEEAIGLLPILPQWYFDPDHEFDKITLDDLFSESLDAEFEEFIENAYSSAIGRDSVSGAGPYRLKTWEEEQYIELERKDDWWGDAPTLRAEGSPFVYTNNEGEIREAKTIRYHIIPEDFNAKVRFEQGEIDLLTGINPSLYQDFKDSDSSYNYFHPLGNKYYYLSLNNSDPLLKDREIRRVLNLLIDKKSVIKNNLHGLASPIYSPIHPNSAYADTSRGEWSDFSLSRAEEILDNEGWKDIDGDGVLEKILGSETIELSTTILVSSGKLGQALALMLEQNAEKIGFEIEIHSTEFSNIRRKLSEKSYHITPLSMRTSGLLYDPYQSWHSDNAAPGKPNYSAYSNPRADSLIMRMRIEENAVKRAAYYREFQREVKGDVPVIFLAAPRELLISQKGISLRETPYYPGYEPRSVHGE